MLGAESVLGAMRATPVQLDMRPRWVETSMAEHWACKMAKWFRPWSKKKMVGCACG